MTTTTKVFVILVCLFAFIFTPMSIQFAARTENWRQTAENFRELAESTYAGERSALAILASERERFKSLMGEQQRRLEAGEQRLAELQQQVERLTQERDQLARSQQNWETSARLLTAEVKVQSTANRELSSAKEEALERERELRANNLMLTDRVKELTAQLVVRRQQLVQKLDEIAGIREENRRLREQVNLGRAGEPATAAPTPTAVAVGPAAAGPIQGQVTRVEGERATINVGSSSGLHSGMVMVVMRGQDYVCDLEITGDLTPNEAIGLIRHESGRRIRQNDLVVDSASFERAR